MAAVSPYQAVRDEVRAWHTCSRFVEVFVSCPLDVLVARDRRNLYSRALSGEIANFTGVSDPYEVPADADVTIDTSSTTPDEAAQQVLLHLEHEGYIGAAT